MSCKHIWNAHGQCQWCKKMKPTSVARGRRRWIAVATTTVPDPRPKMPMVVVTQLIDQDGNHWEKYGDDPPVMLGTPPAVNVKGD